MTARVIVQSHELSWDNADAEVRRLVEYWEGRRQGAPLPARRDLDVLDLRPWLGRLNLFERVEDGELRVRLRGTLLGNFRGHITDGVMIRQTRPQVYAERVILDHRETFARGECARHRVELELDGFRYGFDRLALPLRAGDGLPEMMLVFVQFDPFRSREFWHRFVEADDAAEPAL